MHKKLVKTPSDITVCTMLVSVMMIITACSPAATGEIPPKAVTCAACHGGNGMQTAPAIPKLAGQSAVYLSKQLRAYQSGERKDPVMSALAEALSDEEIESISAWYESLDPCASRE